MSQPTGLSVDAAIAGVHSGIIWVNRLSGLPIVQVVDDCKSVCMCVCVCVCVFPFMSPIFWDGVEGEIATAG